jgi:hypothetical protein
MTSLSYVDLQPLFWRNAPVGLYAQPWFRFRDDLWAHFVR